MSPTPISIESMSDYNNNLTFHSNLSCLLEESDKKPIMSAKIPTMDDTFEVIHKELVAEAANLAPGLAEVSDWIDKLLRYNVPHGKKFRAGLVLDAVQSAAKAQDAKQTELAQVVGWCVELLQASFLVIDDIMDSSQTRRGSPCWYKLSEVGLMACNDGLLLEAFIYSLLAGRRDAIGANYSNIVDLFHEMSRLTMFGQTLDCLSTPMGARPDLRRLTAERFNTIVEFKTAYYTFVLPVRAGLYLAGVSDAAVHKRATAILKLLSHYFQSQDDYLDCYGAPEVIGKIGTDIQDGKCSWLVVRALELIAAKSANERAALYKILQDNYGRHEDSAVAAVKDLYRKLGLEGEFAQFEEKSYKEITDLIAKEDANLQGLYTGMLKKLFKRQK